ncbi:MAG: PIN domain-containing protein [Bacillota bacterium]
MRRLWVDANVILRFVTGDPPEMAEKALGLMRQAEKEEILLQLSPLVIAEVVWVLGSFYKFSRERIAEILASFVTAKGVFVADPDLMVSALTKMAVKNVDFVDAFLAEVALSSGDAVCSFDEDFNRLGVERIMP